MTCFDQINSRFDFIESDIQILVNMNFFNLYYIIDAIFINKQLKCNSKKDSTKNWRWFFKMIIIFKLKNWRIIWKSSKSTRKKHIEINSWNVKISTIIKKSIKLDRKHSLNSRIDKSEKIRHCKFFDSLFASFLFKFSYCIFLLQKWKD